MNRQHTLAWAKHESSEQVRLDEMNRRCSHKCSVVGQDGAIYCQVCGKLLKSQHEEDDGDRTEPTLDRKTDVVCPFPRKV